MFKSEEASWNGALPCPQTACAPIRSTITASYCQDSHEIQTSTTEAAKVK